MGALPYDDKHDNQKVLVDCDVCNKRFLLYPDKVPTCNSCLTDKTVKKNRSNRQGHQLLFYLMTSKIKSCLVKKN